MPIREKDDGGGWKIREIIEPDADSIKRHTQYYFKRKRAPRIELRGKIAKQLAGYVLIEKDLRSVTVWLNEIERLNLRSDVEGHLEMSVDREKFNLIKGLYVAALTFYGKCFTSCEGRRVKLEKSIIDVKFRNTHDEVMRMRHNFAAHSGADSFEEVKIAVVLYPNKRPVRLPKIYRELSQADFRDNHENETFVALAEHVRSRVIDKAKIIENRLVDKEVLPKGYEFWYRAAKKS